MVENYTTVKSVISKVYRDLNLKDEDRLYDMVEWIAEALEQIGAYMQYVHKTQTLEVEGFRAALPCDFHKVVAIEHNGEALRYLSGDYDSYYHQNDSKNLRTGNYSGSSVSGNYGYNINSAFINTNFEKGDIILAYIGVPVDSEGFPLVPDNVSYREALFWYILMKLFLGGYIHPNPQLFNYATAEQRWHHYCSQARGKANMPNGDMYTSIKNQWNRLKPVMNDHTFFNRNVSDSERLTR